MSKPSNETRIISRAKKASKSLNYIAVYEADNNYVKSCMNEYDNRPIIYLLTLVNDEKESCIYVGQSKSQYARFLSHNNKIEFSRIYLFECDEKDLLQNEKNVIREFKPLYNLDDNPHAKRNRQILGINYLSDKTLNKTQKALDLTDEYHKVGLFGFALNPTIFSVLKAKALENKCTCSEMLQIVLENLFFDEIAKQLKSNQKCVLTNLTTTNDYAAKHNRIRESIKQFLQEKERIPGAFKIGRDWIFPDDTPLPGDRRKKC